VLAHLLRIGRRAVVSFPNFGHWRVRLSLLWQGRMPRTDALGHDWCDTPNIHLCTIADFVALAHEERALMERAIAINGAGHIHPMTPGAWTPNLLAEGAIFLLRPRDGA
jgi:methionine biosynthesis protein MetW